MTNYSKAQMSQYLEYNFFFNLWFCIDLVDCAWLLNSIFIQSYKMLITLQTSLYSSTYNPLTSHILDMCLKQVSNYIWRNTVKLKIIYVHEQRGIDINRENFLIVLKKYKCVHIWCQKLTLPLRKLFSQQFTLVWQTSVVF